MKLKGILARSFCSIRTRMILSFLLLISTIILAVSISSYYVAIRDYRQMSLSYTNRILNEINSHIDSYILNVKSMAGVIINKSEIIELMTLYRSGNIQENSDRIAFLEDATIAHLDLVSKTRSEIIDISVISLDEKIISQNPNQQLNPDSLYKISDWYLRPLSYTKEIIVSPPHAQDLFLNTGMQSVISISKAIIDPVKNQVVGVMVIDLNYNAIESICQPTKLSDDGYIYIIDRFGNIIYHPQQQQIASGQLDEHIYDMLNSDAYYAQYGNRIYTKDYSDVTGWSTIGVICSDTLIKNQSDIFKSYFIITLVFIIIAGIIATIISTSITRPIKALEQTMKKVQDGDLSVQSHISSSSEIGQLSNTFNLMLERIWQLMNDVVAKEEQKRISEIKALQAQINPHFLYNTLETIIWLSASGENDKVAEVTSALAKLFRTSINKGTSLVSLKTEIDNIQSYLTIQQVRYKDKLSFSIDIPIDLYFAHVPSLILQPIVENAIYHGIKPSNQSGTISVHAQTQDDILLIYIDDTGVDMDIEKYHNSNSDSHGIGIANVNGRIKLTFGEQYGITHHKLEPHGTRVQYTLPLILSDD